MPTAKQLVPLLVFTLGYVGAAAVYFTRQGNYEFLWYIAVLVFFIGLIGTTLKSARLPLWLLWLLSLWGLLHVAGGGVHIGDHVLYAQVVFPIFSDGGEFTLIKYDQLVHAYGFGVSALLVRYLLLRSSGSVLPLFWLNVVAVCAAMGMGALNEIVEFIAVVASPSTGVGGYYNTALDLVSNAVGATLAVLGAAMVGKRQNIG